jgi:hypothetical protein
MVCSQTSARRHICTHNHRAACHRHSHSSRHTHKHTHYKHTPLTHTPTPTDSSSHTLATVTTNTSPETFKQVPLVYTQTHTQAHTQGANTQTHTLAHTSTDAELTQLLAAVTLNTTYIDEDDEHTHTDGSDEDDEDSDDGLANLVGAFSTHANKHAHTHAHSHSHSHGGSKHNKQSNTHMEDASKHTPSATERVSQYQLLKKASTLYWTNLAANTTNSPQTNTQIVSTPTNTQTSGANTSTHTQQQQHARDLSECVYIPSIVVCAHTVMDRALECVCTHVVKCDGVDAFVQAQWDKYYMHWSLR